MDEGIDDRQHQSQRIAAGVHPSHAQVPGAAIEHKIDNTHNHREHGHEQTGGQKPCRKIGPLHIGASPVRDVGQQRPGETGERDRSQKWVKRIAGFPDDGAVIALDHQISPEIYVARKRSPIRKVPSRNGGCFRLPRIIVPLCRIEPVARVLRSVRGSTDIRSAYAIQAATLLGLSATVAQAAPLQYLSGAGDKAAPVVFLTWGVLLVSVVVVVLIGFLLAAAIWRRRPIAVENTALERDEGGQNWLWIGVGLSALVLLVTVVWTVKVLAEIQAPPGPPAVTIEVTGRQWWWQVRYIGENAAEDFATANEIHIPVGQPVRLKLVGGDVIHSFWVPQLAGKMDAIPGQINETWIEADVPGTYSGQCTEYCGVEHSRMSLRVVAQSPGDFRAWWAHQLAAPVAAADRGFVEHCGGCHAVRGTEANGTMGPNLSHLMQRRTLASGSLPNDAATLASWIADPQALKPGNEMPVVALSPDDRARIVAWLRR